MKVSSRSWHYKLWNYWRNVFGFLEDDINELPVPFRRIQARKNYKPKTLCSYFWQIVIFYTLVPALFLAGTSVAMGVGIALAPFAGIFFGVRWAWRNGAAGREARSRERRAKAMQRLRDTPPPKVKTEKGPNPFFAFLKARKEKVCPLIDLVEE